MATDAVHWFEGDVMHIQFGIVDLKTTRCETCESYFTGPAPIQRGPGGRTMLVCGRCQKEAQ